MWLPFVVALAGCRLHTGLGFVFDVSSETVLSTDASAGRTHFGYSIGN
jgi:hypothetical protein